MVENVFYYNGNPTMVGHHIFSQSQTPALTLRKQC